MTHCWKGRIPECLHSLALAVDIQLSKRRCRDSVDVDFAVLARELAVPTIAPHSTYARCAALRCRWVGGFNCVTPPSPVPPRSALFKPSQVKTSEPSGDGRPTRARWGRPSTQRAIDEFEENACVRWPQRTFPVVVVKGLVAEDWLVRHKRKDETDQKSHKSGPRRCCANPLTHTKVPVM